MAPITLRERPTQEDDTWKFSLPPGSFNVSPNAKHPSLWGKSIKFTEAAITFQMQELPNNRILQSDDRSKFILVSFGDLRFPETPIKAIGDYIFKVLKAGVFLNGVQYRFYHHSNSQLV